MCLTDTNGVRRSNCACMVWQGTARKFSGHWHEDIPLTRVKHPWGHTSWRTPVTAQGNSFTTAGESCLPWNTMQIQGWMINYIRIFLCINSKKSAESKADYCASALWTSPKHSTQVSRTGLFFYIVLQLGCPQQAWPQAAGGKRWPLQPFQSASPLPCLIQ